MTASAHDRAIAALTPFADRAEHPTGSGVRYLPNSWPLGERGLTMGDLRRAREVRSALLSAQGQAGKPVAWRKKIYGKWAVSVDKLYEDDEPLFAQPQPAAGATDDREREELSDALGRYIDKVEKVLPVNRDDLNVLRLVKATFDHDSERFAVTEKDDGHGRG